MASETNNIQLPTPADAKTAIAFDEEYRQWILQLCQSLWHKILCQCQSRYTERTGHNTRPLRSLTPIYRKHVRPLFTHIQRGRHNIAATCRRIPKSSA